MLQIFLSTIKNKKKNNTPEKAKYVNILLYIICVVSLINIALFYYLENHGILIISILNFLIHLFYLIFLQSKNKYIDLLILIELISVGIGAHYTNGIYSPLLFVVPIVPFAVNSIGNRIRILESLILCFFLIFAVATFHVFSRKDIVSYSNFFVHILFNLISLLFLGFYVVMYEHHQQLLEKQRLRLDKLKSEWVSIVSHELRTPLTAIRGAMGLVHNGLAGDIAPKAKELVAIANNNCDRLTRMVNDLLDIEKMERGLISLQLRPCELNSIIRDAAAAYKAQASTSEVELVVSVDEPAIILGDKDRMTQIIHNLLSNAIKFSPKKSKVIVKEILHTSYVRIEVIDQGNGIPKEFEPQLFEKFTQADSSASRQKQGSGLGLAICRSLIQLHKGNIGYEQNEMHGTTFWFEIPLYKNIARA